MSKGSIMNFLIVFGIAAIAAFVGIISTHYLGDDNPVEEECEQIIEDETGKKLDLTPSSPEASTTAETTKSSS